MTLPRGEIAGRVVIVASGPNGLGAAVALAREGHSTIVYETMDEIGGGTAAVAALVMVFEMTLDYSVVIPMTMTVALSYGVRTVLSRQSIYSLKLVRRGHYVPEALQANLRDLTPAAQIMDRGVAVLASARTLGVVARRDAARFYVVVGADAHVIGVVTRQSLLEALARRGESVTAGEVVDRRYAVVAEGSTLLETLAAMRVAGSAVARVGSGAAVGSPADVRGVVGESEIARAMRDSLDLFVD